MPPYIYLRKIKQTLQPKVISLKLLRGFVISPFSSHPSVQPPIKRRYFSKMFSLVYFNIKIHFF